MGWLVVERAAWIFDYVRVASGVSVRAQSEKHFARVVHIAIFIHRHDVFTEHHLPHAPETVHHLERLIRVLLSDADEDQIVKYAFRRQRHVHNLWKIHFEHWRENPHARIADVIVVHLRLATGPCWFKRWSRL